MRTQQNLQNTTEVVIREKCMALNECIGKEDRFKSNNLRFSHVRKQQ